VATVGLIGLGLLGSALAERLRSAGYTVVGYDVSPERCAEFTAAGGMLAASAGDVAEATTTLLLSLPDSQAVAAVIEGLGNRLPTGGTILDTTTGEPQETARLGETLSQRGVRYLDVTIVGSSVQVRAGNATALVGGTEAAYQQVSGVIATFARQAFHVGPCGAGARMKLVVNLVLGLNRAVLAEGLTLARALELDWPLTLEVLRSGAAYSAVMDIKGQKMIEGDFQPQARLSQHLKDVRLMLACAERTGIDLPLSTLHEQLLEHCEAAGLGGLDNSAILRAFDR
jgi:3-hydroxyisobutyrate dehydrogenase-like beta-hydroxyacid dehydrogenase